MGHNSIDIVSLYEDSCKVLGHGFNLKLAIGATKRVTDNGIAF